MRKSVCVRHLNSGTSLLAYKSVMRDRKIGHASRFTYYASAKAGNHHQQPHQRQRNPHNSADDSQADDDARDEQHQPHDPHDQPPGQADDPEDQLEEQHKRQQEQFDQEFHGYPPVLNDFVICDSSFVIRYSITIILRKQITKVAKFRHLPTTNLERINECGARSFVVNRFLWYNRIEYNALLNLDNTVLSSVAYGQGMKGVHKMQVRETTMYAIEFQTHVKDGIIQIPPQYQEQLQNSVRVIILVEPPSPTHTFIDQLLANPLHIPDFQPLSRDEIYAR